MATTSRVKKPKKVLLFKGLLRNDLEYVDAATLRTKIHDQSRFSILYFTLLTSSVLICTLGLLTDSAAIVIGGMLIAPLMWPLARVGYGVAHRSPRHLYRGTILVLASILIGAISAYLITSVSPIKVINGEILARTSPTLMDLFIALGAGLVAAIAITQKKIADSLAGVAIAVSLMPPLCTVGIALSLKNISLSMGALLLFAVNAACITLVTTIVLILTQFARKERVHVATKAMAVNLIFLLLLAVPLVQFLRSYSLELRSYGVASQVMNDFIAQKDAAAEFENIEVKQTDRSTVAVSADLLIPSDLTFTYEDNEELVHLLEQRIDKTVLLNLRIQGIIEPISKNQRENETRVEQLRVAFSRELQALESSYKINSISISRPDNSVTNGWIITADVLSIPDVVPTSQSITEVSEKLSIEFLEDVELNLTFVPRLTLRSNEQTVSEEARKTVEKLTQSLSPDASISGFTVVEEQNANRVSYTITAPTIEVFSEVYLESVRNVLSPLFDQQPVRLQVRLLQATDISL